MNRNSRTRQGCSPDPGLPNIVCEVLTEAIRQEKEIKGMQTGRSKASLFVCHTIQLTKDIKNATRNSQLINTINKVAGNSKYTKVRSSSIDQQQTYWAGEWEYLMFRAHRGNSCIFYINLVYWHPFSCCLLVQDHMVHNFMFYITMCIHRNLFFSGLLNALT